MPKKNTVVIPFTLPWDWSADYQKQTALQLLKKNWRVIVYLDSSAQFFLKKQKQAPPSHSNIVFFQPRYFIPGKRWRWIEELNRFFNFTWLQWKYDVSYWWVFDPLFGPITKLIHFLLPHITTLYDCVDFHSHPKLETHMEIKKKERLLLKYSDFVFVNSRSLERYFQSLCTVFRVPYGFDDQTFVRAPQKTTSKNQGVIGYIGGINYRFDFNLLFQVIESNPKKKFEFWGPVQLDPSVDIFFNTEKNILRLFNYPNVTHSQTSRSELPQIMTHFTWAMIPYRTDILFNLLCTPMKLWEYLYVDLPVISTPIQELVRLKKNTPNLLIKETASEWSTLLQSTPKKMTPITKDIKRISWKQKIAKIIEVLNSTRQ